MESSLRYSLVDKSSHNSQSPELTTIRLLGLPIQPIQSLSYTTLPWTITFGVGSKIVVTPPVFARVSTPHDIHYCGGILSLSLCYDRVVRNEVVFPAHKRKAGPQTGADRVVCDAISVPLQAEPRFEESECSSVTDCTDRHIAERVVMAPFDPETG